MGVKLQLVLTFHSTLRSVTSHCCLCLSGTFLSSDKVGLAVQPLSPVSLCCLGPEQLEDLHIAASI